MKLCIINFAFIATLCILSIRADPIPSGEHIHHNRNDDSTNVGVETDVTQNKHGNHPAASSSESNSSEESGEKSKEKSNEKSNEKSAEKIKEKEKDRVKSKPGKVGQKESKPTENSPAAANTGNNDGSSTDSPTYSKLLDDIDNLKKGIETLQQQLSDKL